MSAPARLRALRLVGFKSFAERTLLEFGPGISAVVGPNGSGKSNLADALRWAFGEQGRSLRTRKSEDVIFAGSATRHATGMADVTLVVDNEDRLLPIDYAELELGRRLYRSGENEYLLNGQRVRLRDLVELLEGANLADNAFLFIGQGMVDQALSLRPEERRPLFEEVAGVRRHERRRRQAEEQLAEAEANLARVRDILAELRPQARRLAAQAEQQRARRSAADELADALVAAAQHRWAASSARVTEVTTALAAARAAADAAIAELRDAEEAAAALAVRLADRAERERRERGDLDALRTRLTDVRLAETRAATELAALRRDRERLEADRTAAETRSAEARRELALPPPVSDSAAGGVLAEIDAELSSATAALEAARTSGERDASVRTARQAQVAELETARRRLARLEDDRREVAERLAAATGEAEEAERLAEQVVADLAAARTAVAGAEAAAGAARAALAAAQGTFEARQTRARAVAARVETARSRLASLEAALVADEGQGAAAAARRRGGQRLAEGLEVDPHLRAAVEAALGTAVRAAIVPQSLVTELRIEQGTLVLADLAAPSAGRDAQQAVDAALAAGGGRLGESIRRDPGGAVSRLLATSVWVPGLDDALAVRPVLPVGWTAVTREGEVVTADGIVRLGRSESLLGRRAAIEAAQRELETLVADVERAERERADAETMLASAGEADRARAADVEAARRELRAVEERERSATRRLETHQRERGWQTAQLERLDGQAERLRADLATLGPAEAAEAAGAGSPREDTTGRSDPDAVAAWTARVGELRRRREAAARDAEAAAGLARALEDRRRRAELTLSMEAARVQAIEPELTRLVAAESTAAHALEDFATEIGSLRDVEASARRTLEALEGEDAEERTRLAELEQAAAAARERLRAAEERSRSSEVAELEARLAIDAIRESLLVELAGLGPVGLRALRPAGSVPDGGPAESTASGPTAPESTAAESAGEAQVASAEERLAEDLERALDLAVAAWAAAGPEGEPPTPGRLSTLRRRYHELGATNPFAAEEYEEVRERLESLEAQQTDLLEAIEATRRLIGELSTLVAERFRATFAALEDAFGRRFEQLFDGGDAQLALTDPDDLSVTGVEIMARPPGKKRQPLQMLSGGERALTAVALLFAMLEVRPVPFCVLDEVDAALDEANVGRFVTALRGLAERTQFIVITHNRGTIESADALYGVTIGDDAVSRVVSMRIAEATALAAERAVTGAAVGA